MSDILTSRITELLRLIQQRLEQVGLPAHRCGAAVLTGGGSLLGGLPGHVASVLGLPTQLADPQLQTILPPTLRQPVFATAVGLEGSLRDPQLGLRFGLNTRHAALMLAPQPYNHQPFSAVWARPGI